MDALIVPLVANWLLLFFLIFNVSFQFEVGWLDNIVEKANLFISQGRIYELAFWSVIFFVFALFQLALTILGNLCAASQVQ